MDRYYIGIDTSAYTTSLAIIDDRDTIIADLRIGLTVGEGKRGLRQKEAIFQHMKNLPILVENMVEEVDVSEIEVVSCSSRPRTIKGSYMPVFMVGRGQALILSKILGCNYEEFSHQEGHIGTGMLNSDLGQRDRFISLHTSGGTTELLMVRNLDKALKIDLIGGTLDLNFGQLIDRIGVKVGLPFPCGREMDKLSQDGNILDLQVPISIQDITWINVSGLENYFTDLIFKDIYRIEDIFATLFMTIARILYAITIKASAQYDIGDVLVTGGVSANSIIRKYLESTLNEKGVTTFFPDIKLCTDNGVGIAYLGK